MALAQTHTHTHSQYKTSHFNCSFTSSASPRQ